MAAAATRELALDPGGDAVAAGVAGERCLRHEAAEHDMDRSLLARRPPGHHEGQRAVQRPLDGSAPRVVLIQPFPPQHQGIDAAQGAGGERCRLPPDRQPGAHRIRADGVAEHDPLREAMEMDPGDTLAPALAAWCLAHHGAGSALRASVAVDASGAGQFPPLPGTNAADGGTGVQRAVALSACSRAARRQPIAILTQTSHLPPKPFIASATPPNCLPQL